MNNLASLGQRLTTPQKWPKTLLLAVAAIFASWYAVFLVRNSAPYAGGSDSSGYLNIARLLNHGEFHTLPRSLPGHSANEFGVSSTIPLGFSLRPDGRMVPTYPTGYPLQVAALSILTPAHAPILVNIATALTCGFLLYAYCRKLQINAGLACGGVMLLWLCPLFLFSAFQPMSDAPSVAWSLMTLYFALEARNCWKKGLLCGAALGVSVLVRPTNILLVVPLLVALGVQPRRWLSVGIGGLPAAVFFCFYNLKVYGSALTTGYDDVRRLFSVSFLTHNLTHFAYWIPQLLSPLIVLALAAPFTNTARKRAFVTLGVWGFTLFGFYAFYYHSGETWWYLRFILPAFPALIIGTLCVLQTAWQHAKRQQAIGTIALLAAALFSAAWQRQHIRQLNILYLQPDERSYLDAATWMKNNTPQESVVFCMQVSGAFFYYTDFLLYRWEQIAPDKYESLLSAIAQQGRPVYAALYSFENDDALGRIGGHWTKLVTVGKVDIWEKQR